MNVHVFHNDFDLEGKLFDFEAGLDRFSKIHSILFKLARSFDLFRLNYLSDLRVILLIGHDNFNSAVDIKGGTSIG